MPLALLAGSAFDPPVPPEFVAYLAEAAPHLTAEACLAAEAVANEASAEVVDLVCPYCHCHHLDGMEEVGSVRLCSNPACQRKFSADASFRGNPIAGWKEGTVATVEGEPYVPRQVPKRECTLVNSLLQDTCQKRDIVAFLVS